MAHCAPGAVFAAEAIISNTDDIPDPAQLYEFALRHSRAPRNAELPAEATAQRVGHNPLCGDRTTVALCFDSAGGIASIGCRAVGCAICVAAASIMTDAVIGLDAEGVRELYGRFDALLGDRSGAQAGGLGELAALAEVRAFPARLRCATLPWETLLGLLAGSEVDRSAVEAGLHVQPAGAVFASDGRAGLDDVVGQSVRWCAQGRRVALATVIQTWGSSPRPAGSQLAVNDLGAFVGSVSGGCVESAVVAEALKVLEANQPRELQYGVSDPTAWEVGLACGGRIRLLVAPAREALLVELVAAAAAKRSAVVAMPLAGGEARALYPFEAAGDDRSVLASARLAAERDQSTLIETEAGPLFLQVRNPPLRMVIVGGVHIAQALAQMAATSGFAVTVIDPRSSFVTAERFPGVERVPGWPQEALAERPLDRRTAFVTLTHDPKIDEPALAVALRSDAFYIGALGSTRTQAARRERLAADGWAPADLARIAGPVGLHIGARSAPEIAVSILAEAIARLRGSPLATHGSPALIAAVVLAAGLSRRMGGSNKLLAEIEGAPLVARAVDAALDAGLAPVVVVTGHEQQRVRAALGERSVLVVHNPEYEQGMSSSLRVGIGALPPSIDGALVCLADMPWVRGADLRALCDRFDPRAGREICVPVHAGQRGNPVLFAARFFSQLKSVSGDMGARGVVMAHPEVVCEVNAVGRGVLLDVDTANALGDARTGGGVTGDRDSES